MKKKVKNRKNQIKLDYLVEIKSISNHDSINSIGIFPSGNFITVSNDKSIIIYDNNLLEIQTILNAHLNSIIYVSIKDDNNFITCSKDISIKIWIKTNNKFQIGQILNNIHSKWINQVIYSEDTTEPEACGNYLLHDLPMCKWESARYLDRLQNDFHSEYTKLQITLGDGRIFADA